MPALLRKFIVALVFILALGACAGGGDGGSTWFNLPSVPIRVDGNGFGTALGFPAGPILQQPMLDQFAAAGVDVLEVRIGYHGVFLHANGEPLPYLKWSDESADLVGRVLANVPQAAQGADALTWLRRVGLGVIIILPGAGDDIPYWQGEELVRAESAAETTIGPLQFASLAFDENGQASFEGIPLAEIEQALGASLGVALPPMALQILSALGVEQFSLATQPNGIDLALDSTALPSLAYDTERLNNLMPIVSAFVDPSMGGMIGEVIPRLPGADLDIIVSFTGQPTADTQLSTIPVSVGDGGSLGVWGIPLGMDLLPSNVLDILGATNAQRLDLSIQADGLYLALNQEPLPSILWTDTSLDTIGGIAVDLLGVSPGMVDAGLTVLRSLLAKTNIGLSLDLPGADAAAFAADFDVAAPNFAAAPEGMEPALQIGAAIDRDGFVQSALGLSLADLAGLLPPVSLPPLVMNIVGGVGSDTLQLTTSAGGIDLVGDAGSLLTLQYDEAALNRLLVVVSSLSDSIGFIGTIEEYLPHLPPVLSSGLDVQLALAGQEAPETKLDSLPVEVKADGSLALMGIPLGDQSILQPRFITDMQALGVQRLDLNIIDASLYLASNGGHLPVISWTDQSMATVQRVVSELLPLPPGMLDVGIGFLQKTDIGVALSIPVADGAAAVDVPPAFDVTSVRMEPPDIDAEYRPVLALRLRLDGSEITSVGGVPASTFQENGVSLPSLPANIASILYDGLQVAELELTSSANQLNVVADEEVLLTVHYDSPSILRTLDLAAPFLPEDVANILADPNVSALFTEELLPLIVGAQLDVTAELNQE